MAAALDTSTLSWVRDEVDLALEHAGAALARHAASPGHAGPLAEARGYLHQACGALALVGLEGVTHFAGGIEAQLAALATPHARTNLLAVSAAAGSAIAALRRYLGELMAGQPDQPLRLAPAYRALFRAAGLPEPEPFALFFPDLAVRPPPRAHPAPLAPARRKALRLGFARGLAKWHAGAARGLTEMRNAIASIEQGCTEPDECALWWVALAWFDAVAAQATPAPDDALLAGLDLQVGSFAQERRWTVPDKLLTGLLYGIAIAPPGSELLESVRSAYGLADLIPRDERGATRRAACRAPLATAMEEWERFGRGQAIALMRFHDVALLLAASARDSNDAELARLAEAIADFAAWLRQQPERADAAMALEVAGALVLMEEAVEQEGARSPADGRLFAAAVATLLDRLAAARQGAAQPGPARLNWHERQLVGQAAREIRTSLEGIETVLDAFFRSPGDAAALPAARTRLHQVAGVLAMLDEAAAARIAAAAVAQIDACRQGAVPAESFPAIAERVAALGEFADALARGQPDRSLLEPLLQAAVDAATAQPVALAAPRQVPPAPAAAPPLATPAPATPVSPLAERRRARPADEVDPQLAPLFLEEADEQLQEIEAGLRAWRAAPGDAEIGRRIARLLHTFKGGARMCGAMGLGELAHSMETRVELALAAGDAGSPVHESLATSLDRANHLVDRLRQPVAAEASGSDGTAAAAAGEPAGTLLRVRADLIDRLVSEAGEMAISRSRIEGSLKSVKGALLDLTASVARLRNQLREFDIHAETGMQSRLGGSLAAGDGQQRDFDPLELDRFTRLQELTRMMAESVSDVAAVQHGLLRQVDIAGEALAAQSRQNRDLSHALLCARMLPFSTVAERLHRVVRLSAKELGRQANLDIRGGDTPVDRTVLERMLAPLEHLLRNAVAHGIEPPAARRSAGKPDIGQITLAIVPTDNDITLTLADDGGGLDFAAIRRRAIERGLLADTARPGDKELVELIFQPGFSTKATVDEVAGRGIGLDVVRAEVDQLGGRIEVGAEAGLGTQFRIELPLSLAVIPVMLATAAGRRWAIPTAMVEEANELDAAEAAARRAAGCVMRAGHRYPWHNLPQLFAMAEPAGPPAWQLLLQSGGERLALEAEALTQHLEVVVKPVGEQLARVPGLAGATVLPDGTVALIVNPVALVRRNGSASPVTDAVPPAPTFFAPLVMVVDDSLTVRKITGRLLERAGYRVATAKDGIDALEQIERERPAVVLADIEMPRMDGFELVRALRARPPLAGLPVVMITSRIAERHRQVARELGVRHYLGKPYDEGELLALIAELLKAA